MHFGSLKATVIAWVCVLLVACGSSDPKAANDSNFTRAIDASLTTHKSNVICLNVVPTFPGTVRSDNYYAADAKKRYDAFVQAGLAESRTETKTEPRFYGPPKRYSVFEYRLSPFGRANATITNGLIGLDLVGPQTKFCYGTFAVGKILNFTEPADMLGIRVTQVRWTPKVVAVADWAKSDRAKRAFPEIEQTLSNFPTQERGTALELTNTGWEAAR